MGSNPGYLLEYLSTLNQNFGSFIIARILLKTTQPFQTILMRRDSGSKVIRKNVSLYKTNFTIQMHRRYMRNSGKLTRFYQYGWLTPRNVLPLFDITEHKDCFVFNR